MILAEADVTDLQDRDTDVDNMAIVVWTLMMR